MLLTSLFIRRPRRLRHLRRLAITAPTAPRTLTRLPQRLPQHGTTRVLLAGVGADEMRVRVWLHRDQHGRTDTAHTHRTTHQPGGEPQ
ncbi:hypothetical protein [Streptomyces albipurpureus]|uniref:Secreted protein n=1 Tax=Streptomyces albipurpureus TaxID=2897419 RepID=A0ABT0V3B5_9ACTN|nr:hypothetical protein [Streptomyces sp. CWNU-1]MCM2394390.1 hypothetical protein [Streptomyces sp. CWNU-1]